MLNITTDINHHDTRIRHNLYLVENYCFIRLYFLARKVCQYRERDKLRAH